MAGILVFGAGGHAKVVADILLSQEVQVIGFLDDDPEAWKIKPLGLPVLGPSSSYADYEHKCIVIGIGSNSIRQKLATELGSNASWCNAIHPRSTIADSVDLGVGVVVAAGAIINPDTIIGDHVIINTGATVDHDCTISSFAHIAPGVNLAGSVTVGEGSLIGIGAKVLPGCRIGRNVTVGAGAVVVDDIPDGIIVRGVPAR